MSRGPKLEAAQTSVINCEPHRALAAIQKRVRSDGRRSFSSYEAENGPPHQPRRVAMTEISGTTATASGRVPWNKGNIIGAKPSLARPPLNQSAFGPFVCSFGQRSAL